MSANHDFPKSSFTEISSQHIVADNLAFLSIFLGGDFLTIRGVRILSGFFLLGLDDLHLLNIGILLIKVYHG